MNRNSPDSRTVETALALNEVIACRPRVAEKMIGVGPSKMKELIRTGRVESVLVGRTRLIKVSSLRRLVGEAA